MEEVDQEFYSIIDAIPSMLEEGQTDQAITLWETSFESFEPQLSTEGRLSAMSFYAQALYYADLHVRSQEVDMKIEELLAGMDEEEISKRLRRDLLRNIAERWGIEIDDGSDARPSPTPPSEASAQIQEVSTENGPLVAVVEGSVSSQSVRTPPQDEGIEIQLMK
jgi:hypothetical protein